MIKVDEKTVQMCGSGMELTAELAVIVHELIGQGMPEEVVFFAVALGAAEKDTTESERLEAFSHVLADMPKEMQDRLRKELERRKKNDRS